MSDEINDGLTDEERAALEINDEEDAPEEVVPGAESAPAADTPKTEDKADDQAKPGADDGAAAAAGDAGAAADAPAADAATAPPDEPEAASRAPAQPAPILVAEAVADADAKLAAITSQKDELATKFDDGDITAKEYHAQLDSLNKQERAIERAQDKAQLAAEMDEQARRNAWFDHAKRFAHDNGYTDPRRMQLLDAEVRAVAGTEEGLKMTGDQVLTRAHQNLVEAGLAVAKAKPAPAQPAKAAAPKPDLPPSIHKLPAADVDNAAGGQWAELDRLATTNPLAYEAKLAAMSDKERDRYLAD